MFIFEKHRQHSDGRSRFGAGAWALRSKLASLIESCTRLRRLGVSLTKEERRVLKNKKHHVVVLDPECPSHTLTTLPDDLIHYSEPRILTVREYARLQSFPDWFVFRGKYTTGGHLRVKECPRYTQVGNAVAPFVAEAMGLALKMLLQKLRNAQPQPRARERQSKIDGTYSAIPSPDLGVD